MPIDLTPRIPITPGGAKTTHMLLLKVNGRVIGRIQSWQPTQSRSVERIFELNPLTTGRAVDLVPGVVTEDNISAERVELFRLPVEEIFGDFGRGFVHLSEQRFPFSVEEHWFLPNGEVVTKKYVGCFLESANPGAYTASGDKVVKKSMTIQVLDREGSPAA